MRQALLDYLASSSDPSIQYARQFYISQWYDENEDSSSRPSEVIREYFRSQWNAKSKQYLRNFCCFFKKKKTFLFTEIIFYQNR